MQRRKFLIGAGSLAAGSAATLGTGAFSSGSIKRGMKAHVANDTNAYVKLEPGNGAKHVSFKNGRLQLDFTNSNGPGNNKDYKDGTPTGLNDNAVSCFDSVLIARIKDPDPQAIQHGKISNNNPYRYWGYVTTDAPNYLSFYWDSNNGVNVTGRRNIHQFATTNSVDNGGQPNPKPEDIWFPIGLCVDLRNTPGINPGDDILKGKHFTFHIEEHKNGWSPQS